MLVLYGPTVTGKTNLALNIAKQFNGELIAADSRQVYKGLDIGSGKVSFDSSVQKKDKYWQVDGIKIHGFDVKKPNTQFTSVDFINFATSTIKKIEKENKKPIIVGGTGFYIKSFLMGIDSVGVNANIKLRKELSIKSIIYLQQKLEKININKYRSMNHSDQQNSRRLIRAIELKMSPRARKAHQGINPTNYLMFGLTAPNIYLYQRADKWLEERFENGLITEVSNLIKNGAKPKWLINLGLEYKWITKFLLKEIKIDETRERLKGDIHAFIRRQKTFFNQFDNIQKYDITTKNYPNQIEKTARSWYNRENG